MCVCIGLQSKGLILSQIFSANAAVILSWGKGTNCLKETSALLHNKMQFTSSHGMLDIGLDPKIELNQVTAFQ